MAQDLTATLEGRTKGEIFTSFDVDAFEVPHGRDEIWRFTPLRRLRGLHDGSAPATGSARIDVTERPGVTVETVRRGDERLGQGGVPADRVAAQAFSSFNSATIVTVGKDTQVGDPIEIAITGPGEGATAYGHLQVRVDELAEAVVVIDQRGSGTYADNIEFVVGDAARLTVVSIADWADDAVHVSSHHATLGKDAVLRHVAVTLGGDLVRLTARARFCAPGGDAELLGLYFADDGQHFESRLLVDHAQPNCRSHVTYKGALQGDPDSNKPDAHTVWVGDVLIRAAATGTDTFETNRNLVLTDGARADSVPNLEIETGEIVGAGHASATGRFDDEQLFYLQARGIPEDQARRLVVRGFFGELIAEDRCACGARAPHRRHRTRTRDNGIENSHLMTTLEIKDLHVSVVSAEDGTDIPILKGVNLTVKSGETHALMGPNGSGKSTLSYAVAGHPKYTVTSGSITLDGQDVLEMSIDERARAGLFLAMQYPIEVPGVSMSNFLRTAATAVRGEAPKLRHWIKEVKGAMEGLDIDPSFSERSVNEGFSGGEKKRHEILQLELLKPKIAILDETDSGLDVDALRVVSDGVNRYAEEVHGGLLLITHYTRILRYIQPQFVHVFVGGRIVESGGPELADELDANGYERFTQAVGA